MSDYGVTSAGFIRKPFNQIESDNETKARELFGGDIDLTVYSPVGLFVKMLSWKENMLWQQLEGAYYANWLDTAEGVNLDRLVEWGGLTRKQPQKAIVKGVAFLGERGTYVRQGFVIETSQSVQYETIREANIGESEYYFNQVCETRLDSPIVTVKDSSLMETGTTVTGAGIPAGATIVEITDPKTIEISANATATSAATELTFHCAAAYVDCRALIAGTAGMIVSNSLTEIVSTPGDGITKVFNPTPSVNGRDTETDSELRARYKEEGAEGAGSSVEAIRNAISELESVLYVAVFENTGMVNDAQDRPPKSVECIVESDEEHDLEIATAIFSTKPAGIATVGEVSVNIPDEYNPANTYEIKFNRPIPLKVFVNLTVFYNGLWEDLSQDELRQNILNYISQVELGGYIQPWRIAAANSYIEEIDDMTVEIETSGYQEISSVTADGHKKFVPNDDCLLDAGTYTLDVTVDGTLSAIGIVIPAGAKWSGVVDSINLALSGAEAEIIYGRIRITSDSHGATPPSTILIADGASNGLLAAIEVKWQTEMEIWMLPAVPGKTVTPGSKLVLEFRELAKCQAEYINIQEG